MLILSSLSVSFFVRSNLRHIDHFGLVLRVLDPRTEYREVLRSTPGAVVLLAQKYCDAT